ncbi:serine/threonine-protein phosphatase [Mesobacillus maritimus]|uniref:PP2C family protein-serine/threonine phosphatase n=1 Tax=Mesobacillus maritimus TaxID=1643336 RepID=UPI00203FD5E2|nr:PP2C family serine/threonine-protein phosphatase [Mesobacillus maritimus]MCM3585265.1 serine/threonine-protein phosphatase [Mesobacillus maritimus]
MTIVTSYHTDVGIKKKANQDALLLKTAKTPKGDVGLFAICDGMGGLAQGELASATVIRGLSEWFDTQMPRLVDSDRLGEEICAELESCIQQLNEKIFQYGDASSVKLGTTLTALVMVYGQYFIAHVGDSRAYRLWPTFAQLTEDQTLVAREVARGNITAEQAKIDPRRNVLLQCVGATPEIDIKFLTGNVDENSVFLLCSDGFYHEITANELTKQFHVDKLTEASQIKNNIVESIETVKARDEIDNISVIVVKVS